MQVLAAIQMIYKIIQGLISLAQFVQTNKDEAWFKDAHKTISGIQDAKTDDQRAALAANLRDVINRL